MNFAIGNGSCRRVLVVDDDPLIQRVSRLTLERAGFEVVVASSLAGAIAQLEAGALDAALLDYFLGVDECGCDLIAPLRARHPAIRVVVMSGLGALAELIGHAHAAGADLVVSKAQVDWVGWAGGTPASPAPPLRATVDLNALRYQVIHGAFLVHRRNVSHTARALGIKRTSLQRILRRSPLPALEED
ncbi:MAG TPA: response regulator [Kofleriaceae bacterium]|nr:response regulator [Kofleriaceae bacterium]